MFPASRPSRGVVSCVVLGVPGHPPKRVVPRSPPRGVLRDWSLPVPGSCRGVVSPLTGGFPHRNERPGMVLAPTAVLVSLTLSPPADGAASRPPPQPPPSPPLLAAPAAVAAALRVSTRGSEATQAAVDVPLLADGRGRLRLNVVRRVPAAAAVAAAAAGGGAAGSCPAALASTAMVWFLLTSDNA